MRSGISDVALALAAASCALPFVLPFHPAPIPSFYDEWLAATLGGLAALGMAVSQEDALPPLPPLAGGLLVFAAFLAIEALRAPVIAGWQPSALMALYAVYAAMIAWLGAALARVHGLERTVEWVTAAFLLGAIVNAAAACAQVYASAGAVHAWFAALSTTRAYGNIAQPNLFAVYLVVGQASLLYLARRGLIQRALALGLGALLAWGIGLSESRAALVASAWVVLATVLCKPGAQAGRVPLAAVALLIGNAAAQLAAPWFNEMVGALRLDTAAERWWGDAGEGSAHARLELGRIALDAFASAPLMGIGAGRFAGAALGASSAGLADVNTHAHNLLLQLLAETGLIGTLAVGIALALGASGLARNVRERPSLELVWIACVAGVLLVHSMLELPFWYAHFLGMAALVIGMGAPGSRNAGVHARRWLCGSMAALVLAGALWMLHDYVMINLYAPAAFMRTFATAPERAQAVRALASVEHGLLAQPLALARFMGLEPRGQLALGERVMNYWPAPAVLVRQAVLLALAGRGAEADMLLRRAAQSRSRPAVRRELESARAWAPQEVEPLLDTLRRVNGGELPPLPPLGPDLKE